MSTTTYHLQFPYTTAAGVLIEELQLSRLRVKDIKAVRRASENPTDWDDILIARSTGLLPEDIEQMDVADYLALQQRFQQVIGLGQGNKNSVASIGDVSTMVPVPAERD
ncbi:phage tail assembly protein [Photorhabdus antumapuensis]|uniref:phage tail assembly protein n=1 Tax=Photorhabdus antumapuensis TaxID=2862867 RepID=UPI001CED449B|nr:phage tail assembly protein [Photorhabdus antumapuensis]MCA6221932.1 phage tail assembly protein [Photorhabdus antumapuensis]